MATAALNFSSDVQSVTAVWTAYESVASVLYLKSLILAYVCSPEPKALSMEKLLK